MYVVNKLEPCAVSSFHLMLLMGEDPLFYAL